jgi:hydrogenase maturation factor
LNTDFGIKNERKDCKIGLGGEWVLVGSGRVIQKIKEGEYGYVHI